MTTKTKNELAAPTIKMNAHAAESAAIYAAALVDACKKVNADPLIALVDAEEFPRLLKIATVEFAIGWLHGCAESHGVTVEVLWEQLPKTAPRGRKRAA
jgi:hypothetical protein